nr:fusion protein [Jingmen Apodemus agrarius jeilongvirus 2]
MRRVMRVLLIICAVTQLQIQQSVSQLALSDLTKIGIIPAKSYELKISTQAAQQLMVIKLIPNVNGLTNCTIPVMESYKKMLDRILKPIDDALNHVRNAIQDKQGDGVPGVRFWGAIIGGVALGVATSAQITAGVALHNSIQNANAILQLKESIRNSNKAIEELQAGLQSTVLVINALQDQINSQLVPAINTLGCSVIANTLGLRLNQYFSEISLVFGPNLRDPTSQTLSIQAIAKAFNGDFDSMMKKMHYTDSDFLDLLESDSIRGRIISVSLEDYLIIIQIDYPGLTTIPNSIVQTFNLITYNYKGTEWESIFPRELLIRGSYISNIDISQCVGTSKSMICKSDTSTTISPATWACATGNLTSCARTRVVNSHSTRFALSGGVLFANCAPIACRCQDPQYSINQEPKTTNVMVTSEDCRELYIDGFYLTLGKKMLDRAMYAEDVALGGSVSVDPIDIGNELNSINESINKSHEYLDKANELLEQVNPNIVNVSSFSFILVISILLIIWFIVTLVWLIYLTKHMNFIVGKVAMGSRSSTVNSLSGFVG